MQGAANFYRQECTLQRKNLVGRRRRLYDGTICAMKPNMARMRLDPKPAAGPEAEPERLHRLHLHRQGGVRVRRGGQGVTEYKLDNGGVGDNLLLEFMSGALKANDVVQRFDLKLLKQDERLRLPGDQAAAAAGQGRVRDA